jgi:hypothetical protein
MVWGLVDGWGEPHPANGFTLLFVKIVEQRMNEKASGRGTRF